jgi:hypothetical protein
MIGSRMGSRATNSTSDSSSSLGQSHPKPATKNLEASTAGQAHPNPKPAAAKPLEFSGTGPQVTERFGLSAGLTRFEISCDGGRYCVVKLLDEEGRQVGEALANTMGSYHGTQAMHVPKDGTYLLNVDAPGGRWTVRVRQ